MTTSVERPVFVDAAGERLFGIYSRPEETRPDDLPALVALSGGTQLTSTNRNRLSVTLCRKATATGFPTFRFDYHGAGDSTGVIEEYRLDRPFTMDLAACLDWLRAAGHERFALFGNCFGARTALATASARSDVEAVVLASPPLRDFAKGDRGAARLAAGTSTAQMLKKAFSPRVIGRLADTEHRRRYRAMAVSKLRLLERKKSVPAADRWVSGLVLDALSDLAARKVPVLLMYGREDLDHEDLTAARAGRLGRLLDDPGSSLEVFTPEGRVQGLGTLDTQNRIADRALQWLAEKTTRSAADAGGRT